MKIHGTAKGGAISKKDFGVAFVGAAAPSEPIEFDAQATTNASSSGTTLTNSSFTVADNSDRILIVCAARYDGSGGDISGITWNGDEEFEIAKAVNGTTESPGRAEIWYLVNPTVTTADVVTTWTANTTRRGAGVYSFYNVAQTDPIPDDIIAVADGIASNTASPTITPTTTGSMIVDIIVSGNGDSGYPVDSLTAGWTSLLDGDRSFSSQYDLEPTIDSANTMSWTFNTAKGYNWIGVEVKQV